MPRIIQDHPGFALTARLRAVLDFQIGGATTPLPGRATFAFIVIECGAPFDADPRWQLTFSQQQPQYAELQFVTKPHGEWVSGQRSHASGVSQDEQENPAKQVARC
jgi:hypothetical protein